MFGGPKKKKRKAGKGGTRPGMDETGEETAAAPAERAEAQATGSQIGRYTIQSVLGQGGMGLVYLAHDPVIGRQVAIKVITARPGTEDEARQYRERFLREAQAAGALIHPHIVSVHDIGQDPETHRPYIVMEHVEGQDLKKVIKARAPLLPEEAIGITLQIASALDFAHSRGIIHRDIKPANVLISENGQVKITDFGVARLPGSDLTQTDQMVGSPGFMSPEQLRGGVVDGRSDLFALGVILYQLLTGRSPFEGESVSEVLYKISTQPAEPPSEIDPDVSADFDPILERALAKDPKSRFQTGREMMTALRGIAGDPAPGAEAAEGAAAPAPNGAAHSAAMNGAAPSAPPSAGHIEASVDPAPAPSRAAAESTPPHLRRARGISPWLNPSNHWRLAFLATALLTLFIGMNWAIHALFQGPLSSLAGNDPDSGQIVTPGSGSPNALGLIGAPLPTTFGEPGSKGGPGGAGPKGGAARGASRKAGANRQQPASRLQQTLALGRQALTTVSQTMPAIDMNPQRPIAPVCAMTYASPPELARLLAIYHHPKGRGTQSTDQRAAQLRLEFSHKLASGRVIVRVDGKTVFSKPFEASRGKRGGMVSHLLSIPAGRHGVEVSVLNDSGKLQARSRIAGILGRSSTAVLKADERTGARKPLTLEWGTAD